MNRGRCLVRTNWKTMLLHSNAKAPDGFRSLTTPVYRGSTTLFTDASAVSDTWDHDEAAYTYGLYGTPTTLELAARISELEHGYRTFITPGGQSALAMVYLAYLGAGDHVLIPESVYGPSRNLAGDLLRRCGIEVEFYSPMIGSEIDGLIKDTTRLIWCESPGSVTMEVQDVPAIVDIAHRRGAVVALDNTWSAGVLFDAFRHGVDVSMQALTKYIGGHSDLLLGSVTVRNQEHYRRLGDVRQHLGLAASPDDCSLALRGLQTLAVRLAAIDASALRIARWLAGRPEIEAVLHPALPSCPGHTIWQRDFTGASGLFSIVFVQPVEAEKVRMFVDNLTLFAIGYSWGGVASLAVPWEVPATRAPYGGRLVRFNIGLEDTDDLIADLEHALSRTFMT
jgi:cysteine-S-conjugate beta-lyase